MSTTSRPATESGEIQLTRRDAGAIRTSLREWTNRVHAGVLFEMETFTSGVPSTQDGLRVIDAAVGRAAAQASSDEGPVLPRLVTMLALSALEQHLDACRGTGRFKAPSARVLDELLPRRRTKDTFFRVPDERGHAPGGLTLDYDSLVWHAEACHGRPASSLRASPLAVLAFSQLDRLRWKPGLGGEIRSARGTVVLSYP